MKTMRIGKTQVCIRVPDNQVEHWKKEGFHLCSKSIWKKFVRNKK